MQFLCEATMRWDGSCASRIKRENKNEASYCAAGLTGNVEALAVDRDDLWHQFKLASRPLRDKERRMRVTR